MMIILFCSWAKNIHCIAPNCFINFVTFAAQPFINIHDIIVVPKARGIGVGRALMEAIIKKANELNCAKITLEVREDNHLAQNLYKKLGFKDGEPKMLFWTKYLL
jgi:ribosomal protein S18 acetylase RimI-like enzyme